MKQKKELVRRSDCPIACTLDLVGDKWTLLVVRDLALGRRTYSEMAASPERIPTNILAERLKRLERGGIIKRVLYQEHPPRYAYALTQSGKELGSVLWSIVAWGKKYIPGTKTPMEIEADEQRKQENKNDAKFRKI